MNPRTLTSTALAALILVPSTGWAMSTLEPIVCTGGYVKLIQGVDEARDVGIQLDAGTYDLYGTSTDAYLERVAVTQLHEQWVVVVGGVQVHGPTPDLADRVASASVDIAGSFTTHGGRVVVKHVAQVQHTDGTPNSVTVARLCFTRRVDPTTATTVPPTIPVTVPTTSPVSTFPPAPPAFPVATTTTTAAPVPTTAPVVQTSSTVLERTTTTTAPAVPVVAPTPVPTVEARPAVAVLADPTFTG